MPNSTVCLSFDFDAMSVWYGYKNVSAAMLYRGEYGARVGVPRILELLQRYRIPTTFFIPGHTVDSFPEPVEAILKGGYEIGHHSYAHVDPSDQTSDEEGEDMQRAFRTFERIGVRPVGFRSPSLDFSNATLALIESNGFIYDSSLMADDFRPYHPRLDDRVTQQTALIKGREARVWELPLCFEFDDWVHFQFNFNPYRNGTSAPSKVFEIWTKEFDWMHENVDGGVLTVAMHPQVIGRGHRVAMLEDFIKHCLKAGDMKFEQMCDVAKRL